MSSFFRKLQWLVQRRKKEAELREELEFHLDEESEERSAGGLPEEQARFEARRDLGNITLVQEETRAAWSWLLLERLGQDVRYAVRAARKNKMFTILAALSLALGIGANTAIFSFMDSILLRALPVQKPESLVMLNWRAQPRSGVPAGAGRGGPFSFVAHNTMNSSGASYNDPRTGYNGAIFPYGAFELFQRNDRIFESIFAHYTFLGSLNVNVAGQADVARGGYVSGDYFRGLGVVPESGRLLTVDDDHAGAAPVLVVSYGFARKHFGEPANVLGKSILINNVSFTVVGATPAEFFGVDANAAPDLYMPLHANLLLETGPFAASARYADPNSYWIEIMARLRPGVTIAQAQTDLAPVFQQWVAATATNDRERADLPKLVINEGAGGLDVLRRQYSEPLYVLMTLVGLILAIAGANIANLLLARAAGRRREIAVRLSIGAGRARVVLQLLTESLLLAVLGGALGLMFAVWGIRFLSVLLMNGRENLFLGASLNWHVLALTAGLSVLTGIVFGLAPALQSTRGDVMPSLKDARSAERGYRTAFRSVGWNQVLIVSQIVISLLLLVAAGLFVRTLSNLQSISVGFNRENLLLFQLTARQPGARDTDIAGLYLDLLGRFRSMPGVRSASLSRYSLVGDGAMQMPVALPGEQPNGPTQVLTVGPSFFATMQIPMLAGREIDEGDLSTTRAVAVVNDLFAKAKFGGHNPIGGHISIVGPSPRDLEIIGVSGNVRYAELKEEDQPIVYFPFALGVGPPLNQMTFELRTTRDPLAYMSDVRNIVHQRDARVPVSNVRTQTAQIDRTMNQEIIFARLCSALAILALIIAGVGLYATLSYNVARRTREIGIRIALGAPHGAVVWMILRELSILTAAALVISAPTALALSQLIGSFLFKMKPNDPIVLGAAVMVLVAVAFFAAYAPARKASRIDPTIAVRNE
jgi:macrolide transport system ATP-binding/permease protein